MHTRKPVPLLLVLLLTLSGCGFVGGDRGPEPLTPMPSQVPSGPEYVSVDDVITALGRAASTAR